MHTGKHELAGQTVKIKREVTHLQFPNFGGSEFVIYAMRAAGKVPVDDEVVYGHTKDNLGHLVHVSEIE